ncbi:MAG TPA: YfaZ family outer membrane protein [Gammaproteobacteria bacterium]
MIALLPTLAFAQQEPEAGTQAVEAYLSEDAMQVLYGRDMDVGDLGRNQVRIGIFLNEERDLIGIADMMFDVGEPNRRPYWSLQVGPRAYGALMTIENQDIFSIALGGRLSYFLGRGRGSSIALTAFYAPDIVTFGNADNIKDIAVTLETSLSESTNLFIGYRVFEFDLEVDREVDDNMHLGVRHRF